MFFPTSITTTFPRSPPNLTVKPSAAVVAATPAAMWTYFTNWLTPTSLFILVNAVIATIAITSLFAKDKSHTHRQHPHGGAVLIRPPSFLDRVKSFNFPPYSFHHHPYPGPDPPARAPSMLERLKSITLNRSDSAREPETPQPAAEPEQLPETTHRDHAHSVSRSKSEGETHAPVTSLRRRLQKSLSEKLSWASFAAGQGETEELASKIEQRRPATARPEIRHPETAEGGEEEEVDMRADDFINRFKQQLKLQRLESLLRYRDMVNGKKQQ